eukprot:3687638-Amphidinium_carterae.1
MCQQAKVKGMTSKFEATPRKRSGMVTYHTLRGDQSPHLQQPLPLQNTVTCQPPTPLLRTLLVKCMKHDEGTAVKDTMFQCLSIRLDDYDQTATPPNESAMGPLYIVIRGPSQHA